MVIQYPLHKGPISAAHAAYPAAAHFQRRPNSAQLKTIQPLWQNIFTNLLSDVVQRWRPAITASGIHAGAILRHALRTAIFLVGYVLIRTIRTGGNAFLVNLLYLREFVRDFWGGSSCLSPSHNLTIPLFTSPRMPMYINGFSLTFCGGSFWLAVQGV